jgi:hypothetical protein
VIDRRGILSYLAITFVVTYAIEGALIASGFRVTGRPALYGQLVIAGVMWVPTLATILTIRFVTHEGFGITYLRIGPWRPYLKTALVIPAAFVAIYGLTWLLGLGQPDWQLTDFRELVISAGANPSEFPSPSVLLPAMFLATFFVTPFFNSVFGFGEEFGWRGYLLPKLMPLGKTRAYLLVGVIWGLWHVPVILIGFNYPGYPVLGVVWMAGMTTALSFYINELALRHQSSILAGWMHGVFNSQGYGIWRILFADVNPLLGGMTGLVGIAVWFIIGLWEMNRGSVEAQGL